MHNILKLEAANSTCIAFFYSIWALEALLYYKPHSPVHTHIHTSAFFPCLSAFKHSLPCTFSVPLITEVVSGALGVRLCCHLITCNLSQLVKLFSLPDRLSDYLCQPCVSSLVFQLLADRAEWAACLCNGEVSACSQQSLLLLEYC